MPDDPVLNSYNSALADWDLRLLSLVQSNPVAPYYGCIDRDYWHYRAASYFPSAMFQVSVLSLTLGFLEAKNEGRKSRFRELAVAALRFWSKMQRQDGSHDEWYIRERSYAATAFSGFAVSESILLFQEAGVDIGSEIPETINSLAKTAHWLSQRTEPVGTNHTAGGIAALNNIGIITGENRFKKAARKILDVLAGMQHEEGWLPEYGGADAGYLSLSIDYLSTYLKRGGDNKANEIISKALPFLAACVNPDGSFNGEYGSRNTKFLMPHGLENLKSQYPLAGQILNQTFGKGHQQLVGPRSADDRYFTFFFLWNYLWARQCRLQQHVGSDHGYSPLPPKSFPVAGIFRATNAPWAIITNLRKGGLLRAYLNDRLVLIDGGYYLKVGSKQWATSQVLCEPLASEYSTEAGKIIVSCTTALRKTQPLNPLDKLLYPFHLYQSTLARFPRLAELVSHLIKKVMIARADVVDLQFKREITVYHDRLEIRDQLIAQKNLGKVEITGLADVTTMHNPSSRLMPSPLLDIYSTKPLWTGNLEEGMILERELLVLTDGINFQDTGIVVRND